MGISRSAHKDRPRDRKLEFSTRPSTLKRALNPNVAALIIRR